MAQSTSRVNTWSCTPEVEGQCHNISFNSYQYLDSVWSFYYSVQEIFLGCMYKVFNMINVVLFTRKWSHSVADPGSMGASNPGEKCANLLLSICWNWAERGCAYQQHPLDSPINGTWPKKETKDSILIWKDVTKAELDYADWYINIEPGDTYLLLRELVTEWYKRNEYTGIPVKNIYIELDPGRTIYCECDPYGRIACALQ